MKKRLRLLITAIVFAGAIIIPSLVSAQQGGTACYFYDANGRLHSVAWSSGEVAIYQYDAAGNLLGISRTPTPSSITGFSPTSGPTGTLVVIDGAGFGATSRDNRVTFNGLPGEVVSATSTQVMAKAPDGATTGPIAVLMETSVAISSTPFTVTLPLTGPTITSFTPTIGLAGTAVTINGANFDTASTNDQLKFNVTTMTISSASATTLTTTIPSGTTSGHISLTTPSGSTVSSGDFFVPPSPKTPADVEFTGRMALGDTRTVTINTNSKVGLMLFDGTAGQKMSMLLGATTLQGLITVYNPAGAVLASAVSATGSFIDAKTLPTTGTYTILIAPFTGQSGSMTLTLSDVSVDATASVVPGGPPATVTTTAPGQNATLTFNGTVDEKVSVHVLTSLPINSTVTLLDPVGQVIGSDKNINGAQDILFIEPLRLLTTGTYKVVIDPAGTLKGNLTCAVYDVPDDVTGTITPGGPMVTIPPMVPGQNASLTFDGTAGQPISFLATYSPFATSVSILKPDSTTLGPSIGAPFNQAFIDRIVLPVSGTYTILLNPFREGTGPIACTLYAVPPDATATLTPDGTPVTVTTTTPGQNAQLSFTLPGRHSFSLVTSFTTGTPPALYGLRVRSEDSGLSFSNPIILGSNFAGPFPWNFDTTGHFTVTLDPNSTLIGSLTVTVYDVPPDMTGTITAGGPPVTVPLAIPGQNASLTFAGVAGQKVSILGTGATAYAADVRLLRPNGAFLNSASVTNPADDIFIDATVLPDTGTYTITIDPKQAGTGTRTFTLYNIVDATGTLEAGGSPVTVNLDTPGQNGTLTFTSSGQVVTIHVNNQIGSCVTVELDNPDGSSRTGAFWCDGSGSFDLETFNLPAGTYTIRIDPDGAGTGSLTVSATSQ